MLATALIFPAIDYNSICRFREMDAFAGSVNEAPLLMTVWMGFSSIASSRNVDEASTILIWLDRTEASG